MTTDLAAVPQLPGTPDLPGHDREAAEAVASSLQDAKADNTRRSYPSAWRRFQTWTAAGGHQALPATPQTVALYLGHLAATGRSMATIEQARAAISHAHAHAGIAKADNPARHPVVAEAVKGWRNQAAAPRQGRRADRRCPGPGPRDCPAAPAWTCGAHGVDGLVEDLSRHNGRVGMTRRMVRRGSADRSGPAPRAMEARQHGRPVHPGRGRRGGAEVVELTLVYSPLLNRKGRPQEATTPSRTSTQASGKLAQRRRWTFHRRLALRAVTLHERAKPKQMHMLKRLYEAMKP